MNCYIKELEEDGVHSEELAKFIANLSEEELEKCTNISREELFKYSSFISIF